MFVRLLAILVYALTSTSLVFAEPAALKGRNFQVYRIGVEQGLSQAKVNAVVQDRQGYMWFATQEGLNRYDGRRIKSFYHIAGDPKSLSHDWVWDITLDHEGALWVATAGGGLNRYDPQTESFQRILHRPGNLESIPSNRVRALHVAADGHIWVGTEDSGFCRLDPLSLNCERFLLQDAAVSAIQQDRQGYIWVAHLDAGMFRKAPDETRFQRVANLPAEEIRNLYLDRAGQLWVASFDRGLYRYVAASGEWLHEALIDERGDEMIAVRDIVQGSVDSYWVATDQGLVQRFADGSILHYRHDPTDPRSLSTDPLLSLFTDADHNLWIGSYSGVNFWSKATDTVRYIDQRSSGLATDLISALAVDKQGNRWVGVYPEGLMVVSAEGEVVEHYQHDPESLQALSDGRVMSIAIGLDETVWIGTRAGGLNELRRDTGQFVHHVADPQNPTKLAAPGIAALLVDDGGRLWVGTHGGGLHVYQQGAFKRYQHDPETATSLSSDRVVSLAQDVHGYIWVGTEDGGLNRFDPTREVFYRFWNSTGTAQLPSSSAWHVHYGNSGDLWVSTAGYGLAHLPAQALAGAPEDMQFNRFTSEHDGLVGNTITAAIEDAHGAVWLSSNRGLSVFSVGVGVLHHFDHRHGLRGNEFHQGLAARQPDGQIIFGSNRGVAQLNPDTFQTNADSAPQLSLQVSNRDGVLYRGFSSQVQADAELALNYPDYSVSFEFEALEFASPESIKYQFLLHGFDEAWRDPGEYPRVNYTNLPPGDYVFEVRAFKANPNAGLVTTQVKINVIPPPWRSNWAMLAYVVIFVLLGLGVVSAERNRRKRAAENKRWLELQVAERTAELESKNQTLELLNDRLRDASLTDPLTELRNRRFFYEVIEGQIAQIDRRWIRYQDSGRQGSMPSQFFMMIDLDGFKQINDTHGHQAGDLVLQQLAVLLLCNCRQSDIVVRWGGDEFMITGQLDNLREIELVATRLCQAIADYRFALGNDQQGRLTASVGITHYPFAPMTRQQVKDGWEQVADLADRAAYLAKTSGKDRWVRIIGTQATDLTELPADSEGMISLAKQSGMQIFSSVDGHLAA